jgi:hypothetical protein
MRCQRCLVWNTAHVCVEHVSDPPGRVLTVPRVAPLPPCLPLQSQAATNATQTTTTCAVVGRSGLAGGTTAPYSVTWGRFTTLLTTRRVLLEVHPRQPRHQHRREHRAALTWTATQRLQASSSGGARTQT